MKQMIRERIDELEYILDEIERQYGRYGNQGGSKTKEIYYFTNLTLTTNKRIYRGLQNKSTACLRLISTYDHIKH